tara:strand:+ start:259 stop:474 length:216 start_codon:yes stop_codon:yes gene_type:complete
MRNNPDDLSNQLIAKIKKWLKKECKTHDKFVKRVENGEQAIDICDDPEALYYRNECASDLILQIKKWEKNQ